MFRYQITVNLFLNDNVDKLNDSLNELGENVKVFGNTWLVKSDLRPNQIQELFKKTLSKKDYYTVLEINKTTGSIIVLPQDVLDWFAN